MKKLKCKLIVSDFDGTLANSRNEVPDEVVKAINTYISDGGIFAVCTGRILPSILPRVRNLGLKGLVIACQGAVIADIQTGKLIRDVALTNAQTAEICAALEELNSNVQVYNNEGFYSSLPADEKHLKLYEIIIGVQAQHVSLPLSEYVCSCSEKFNKVAALCRPEEQERLYASLLNRFGNKYDVTCSAKVLVEISPYGETKGKALEYLANHYGVKISDTCAVGDNLNDLSMIETAGFGVAVGNAANRLKDRAEYVTVTNDEGALARVIKDFGYTQYD